ncbi:MAG: hypothetical protein H6831_04535 [Planctomycetes bacterium]|nr:hypothetical protein [Planctomycetota bacterium]MCB9903655.1 hypothetical protein [Planctomycetota bacterium]
MHFRLERLAPGLALLALGAPASARRLEVPRTYAESVWTMEQGLPQDSVTGIAQDADGYFWISTFGGLARFDGVHFHDYYVGNRPDLLVSRFSSVAVDREGGVWTVGQRVGLLRYADDRFEHFEFPGGSLIVSNDADGGAWVHSTAGLGRITGTAIEFVRAGEVRGVHFARDGTLWVTTVEDGLVEIEAGVERVLGDVTSTPGRPFVTMTEDREGRLWGGNWRGLWRATDATNTSFEKLTAAGDGIRQLALGREGEVWIGAGTGLMRYSAGRLERVREDSGYNVLFADARGNLWCTGSGNGLRMIRPSIVSEVGAMLGLEDGDVWSVAFASDGTLAVVQREFLTTIAGDHREREEFAFDLTAALYDRSDTLWLGGVDRIARLRGDDRAEFPMPRGASADHHALFVDADDVLWAGSRRLYRFDADAFVEVRPDAIEDVYCIRAAEDEALWIGTQVGLARMSRDGAHIEWLTSADGLAPGAVRAVYRDERDVLWVATYGGGLSRVEDGRVASFTRETGLHDDFLSSILEDDVGRLWFNSNRGPFTVERSALDAVARGERNLVDCISFTTGEGAREASGGNQPSAAKDAEGRLWMPNVSGLSVVDPAALRLDDTPPRLVVEGVDLSPQRELLVEFAALGFTWPERVQVQYRLVDLEERWINARGRRELEFSFLPPGDYELQLRARNGSGPWSDIVSRSISVPARFHETWTFRVLSALALGIVAFVFGALRLRRVRAHAERLRELYRGRDAARLALGRSREELRRLSRLLLSQQEDQLRTISAELHDDVCQRIAALAIQMELIERRLRAAPDGGENGLRPLVQRAQQLAGDVQMLSRRLHPMGLVTLGMGEALRQECDALQRRAPLTTLLEDAVASDEVPQDVAVAAVRIAQESMHNAEKHAGASTVRVKTEVDGDRFVLRVSDDGAGFDLESGGKQGLGLVTMRERAASVGGDLTVTTAPDCGTEVVFTVVLEGLDR